MAPQIWLYLVLHYSYIKTSFWICIWMVHFHCFPLPLSPRVHFLALPCSMSLLSKQIHSSSFFFSEIPKLLFFPQYSQCYVLEKTLWSTSYFKRKENIHFCSRRVVLHIVSVRKYLSAKVIFWNPRNCQKHSLV